MRDERCLVFELERGRLGIAGTKLAACRASTFTADAARHRIAWRTYSAAFACAPAIVAPARLHAAVAARLRGTRGAFPFAFARAPHAGAVARLRASRSTGLARSGRTDPFALARTPFVIAAARSRSAIAAGLGIAWAADPFSYAVPPLALRVARLRAAETTSGFRAGDAVAICCAFRPSVADAGLHAAEGSAFALGSVFAIALAHALRPAALGAACSNAAIGEPACLGFTRLALSLFGAFTPHIVFAAGLHAASLAVSRGAWETHSLAGTFSPDACIRAGLHAAERTALGGLWDTFKLVFARTPSRLRTGRSATGPARPGFAGSAVGVHARVPAAARVADLAPRFAALLFSGAALALRLASAPRAICIAHEHATIAAGDHLTRVADPSTARPLARRGARS